MNNGKPRIYTPYDDDESFIRAYKRIHSPDKPKTREQIIRGYWNSMRSRVKNGIYAKKGIQILWTYAEFSEWFNSNWKVFDEIVLAGEIPSVDRIDSNGNYQSTNCRMIPMSVNSALGEVNALISRMKTLQKFLEENKHWLITKNS